MIRILVVDDHAVVRSGLRRFLGSAREFAIAGEAANGAEALEQVRLGGWDLVLLDIGLPDMNGLDVLRVISEEFPQLPVLIFSMCSGADYALKAIEAGAAGFLAKDAEPDEILVAIRRVSSGECYLSPDLAQKCGKLGQ